MQIEAAIAYTRAIRNPAKKAYAEQYLAWIIETTATNNRPDPPQPSCLSTMAAQAVRMRLAEFVQ